MRVRLQVTGGEAIRRTLATLDDAVSREVSTAALLAAAAPIVDTASRLCPRGQTRRTWPTSSPPRRSSPAA